LASNYPTRKFSPCGGAAIAKIFADQMQKGSLKMSHEAMFELGASELEHVAGEVGAAPVVPSGTTGVKYVSNGPNGVETGTLFATTFGSVFVSAQPGRSFRRCTINIKPCKSRSHRGGSCIP
jgi:hypothetical protein